jgi:transposase
VRGLGCPARIILTVGQRGDAPQAALLLGADRPAVVLADTAYDADHFRAAIAAAGACPQALTRLRGFAPLNSHFRPAVPR